jgi:tyrosine ammonia-lyase
MTPISLQIADQLPIAQVRNWLWNPPQLQLSAEAADQLRQAEAFLNRQIQARKLIYGVTTGYGPLASEYLEPALSTELQRRLIYHLASGVGEPFSPEESRAILLARLQNLLQGHSAVRVEVVEQMIACWNQGLLPVMPELGTVGASGDLTPLAHLALALMGEGEFWENAHRISAREALADYGRTPLELHAKDGLALVNGTSAMTGLSLWNSAWFHRALDWALRLSFAYAEIYRARREAFSPRVGEARRHPGQVAIHQQLWSWAQQSQRLQPYAGKVANLPRADTPTDGIWHAQALLQDPYSIRCLPQIFGAITDVLAFHDTTVEREFNATTDNPLVFAEGEEILHAGNFYGQHVAFAADALCNAVLKLAILAERQVARITDVQLSPPELPAFLQPHRLGLNSGFMGAQVTATALVAELRTHAIPASVQSVATNANNQDVVSMGTIAARKVARLRPRVFELLAVEALVLAQALELCGVEKTSAGFSPVSQQIWEVVRQESEFLREDRPLAPDLQRVAGRLQNTAASEA